MDPGTPRFILILRCNIELILVPAMTGTKIKSPSFGPRNLLFDRCCLVYGPKNGLKHRAAHKAQNMHICPDRQMSSSSRHVTVKPLRVWMHFLAIRGSKSVGTIGSEDPQKDRASTSTCVVGSCSSKVPKPNVTMLGCCRSPSQKLNKKQQLFAG